MPRAFRMTPTTPVEVSKTTLLGSGTGSANNLSDSDANKLVKLVGESRHDLCAVGDQIEGYITSVEPATSGGYSLGGICQEGRMFVTFDGLQATPGTGTIAINDYVVTGTVTAKGTVLPGAVKVCKATAAPNTLLFKWRVISLGAAGTGAVGTVGVVENLA